MKDKYKFFFVFCGKYSVKLLNVLKVLFNEFYYFYIYSYLNSENFILSYKLLTNMYYDVIQMRYVIRLLNWLIN